jgi:hypothetical protein
VQANKELHKTALETNELATIDKYVFFRKKYNIKVKALAEDFKGKGVVMTLEENI